MIFKGKIRKVLSIALLVCYILLSSTISQSAKENVSTQTNSSKTQDVIGINKTVNTQSVSTKDDKTSERVIVKFKDSSKADTIKSDLKSKLKLNKLDSKRKIKNTNIEVLEVNKSDLDITVNGFKENIGVEYAQPDYLLSVDSIPQDERFSEQWGLNNSGQTINGQVGASGIDVSVIEAWDVNTGGGNITVGVLDTGIDINHVDINTNIYINPNEIPNDGIDNDNNGYIDDVKGFDFANNDNTVYDSAIYDKHGTHIAGIIAGKADNIGIRGVASNVKVMPLKFINGTTGYTSDAVEAIEYAKSMGIKIINCSFGSIYSNPALLDAAQNSNILFACAAGNGGVNIDNSPIYPACFDLPNIISVGAIDNTGNLASFSNYGSKVNVVAPGKDILSTVPGNCYEYMSGTSMSTPFVTGAIALLSQSVEQLSNDQIKAKLCETATTIVGNNSYNYRLVNIASALGIVDNAITPTPSATPDPLDIPEKPQPSFDIIQKDIQFAEYKEKLKELEEQAINADNIDLAKTIEERLNSLIIRENKLRQLPEDLTIDSKDQEQINNVQLQVNSYYATNGSEFINMEHDYHQAINEFINLMQTDIIINTSSQTINLNTPIDVSLSPGGYQVYEFTPPGSGTYIIRTGPYAGTGSSNDTYLEVYTNSSLTNKIASDDDSGGSYFSKITMNLSYGITYYVKLRHYNASSGSVYARLSVAQDAPPQAINLNNPVDVSLGTGIFKVFQFTPTSSGTYSIFTGSYGGTGSSNDTYLELYSDAALTNRIAYDDNSAGNLFSKINKGLISGTIYYITIRPYSNSGSICARLSVAQVALPPAETIYFNSPVDVSLSTGEYKVFQFTPTSAGTYNIFTGPYAGTGGSNDTYLELYSDSALVNKIDYNDDSGGNLFSKISKSLSYGTTYYIKLRHYNATGGTVHARLTIDKDVVVKTISLNHSIDLQAAQGEYIICKFTPTVSGEYKIFTSPNESVSNSNDTYLELYTNQALTNMISFDDDSGEGYYSSIQYKLNAGTTYYVKFRGYANASAGGKFTISLFPDIQVPSTPTNLASSTITESSVVLNWSASNDNVSVVGYNIYKDGIYLSTTANTNYQVTGLSIDKEYLFTVKAKDAASNLSDASNQVIVKTLPSQSLTANAIYNEETGIVTINGTISSGQGKQITILVKDQNGAIKYIDQLVSDANGSFVSIFKINSDVAGIYTVKIGANGILGPIDINLGDAVRDIIPPSTPTNLVSSAITESSVVLNWSASNDNVSVTGYNIYRDGICLSTTANTNYQAVGLNPATEYKFTIKAKDAAGNLSNSSSQIIVNTLVPLTPGSLTANIIYNEQTGIVTINGTISNGQGRQITILVKDKNEAIKYIDQLVSGVNGSFLSTFKINPIEAVGCTVRIGGDGITASNFTFNTSPYNQVTEKVVNYNSGQIFSMALSAYNIKDIKFRSYLVEYDPQYLSIEDLCELTYKIDNPNELEIGKLIQGTGIILKEYISGRLVLGLSNTYFNDTSSLNGMINRIRFKKLKNGESNIKVTLR